MKQINDYIEDQMNNMDEIIDDSYNYDNYRHEQEMIFWKKFIKECQEIVENEEDMEEID